MQLNVLNDLAEAMKALGRKKKRVERPGGSHEGVGRKNYLWN